ncbi:MULTISPECIES: TPR end-of-group domain-containing protein [unclassified Caballeronia]|uniref:TPR end-of-group domain-containing protein n=1 Tax=unclassified Caballeronia TaxID=2646786 RepID=UPI002028FAF6|nr:MULTISPECIES: hypothetical protein [unclassified Caballeronia]MDR5770104.1 hypothetical protein [Caballeronia sp. LZ028]
MRLRQLVLPVACALALVSACSRQDRTSVIGHWQAERTTFFSAQLPVGPDIVIGNDAISVPGTDARIPLSGITQKGDEAVLEMPLGVGLSFFFDGPDRMHLSLPVVGKVYYRRVHDAVAAAPVLKQEAPVRTGSTLAASSVVAAPATHPTVTAQAVATPVAAIPQPSSSTREFDRASLAAQQGDQEAAIDHLSEALRQGFRGFDKLDSAQEFASLRSDVRYQALLARYR